MGKYLKFYEDCMVTGFLPRKAGLCREFTHKELKLIKPTTKERNILRKENYFSGYWGSGFHFTDYPDSSILCGGFTPLRQTIVLLLAAMNNEL